MRRIIAWTLPLLLLAGLVVLAVLVIGPDIEDEIQDDTEQILAAAGYPEIVAEVDGQDIRLSNVPADRAEEIGRLVQDGVDGARRVVVAVPPTAPSADQPDPVANLLVEIGERPSLSGTVATPEQIDQLSALANELFGNDIDINLRSNPNFDAEIVDSQLLLFQPVLESLAGGQLVEGTVRLSNLAGGGQRDYGLFIDGTARDETARDAINDAATRSNFQTGFQVGIAESINPEFTGEQIEPELLRIKLYTIRFSTGDVELSAADEALLGQLAETMMEYPTIEVTVVGHRSSVEGPARGERRAENVAAELINLGIDDERITIRDASDVEGVPGTADTLNARVSFEPVARSTQ